MLSITRSNESKFLDSLLKEAGLSKKAVEFATQEAMDKYLKDHPGADKSLHKVVETKKEEGKKPEEKKEDLKSKIEEKKKELKAPEDEGESIDNLRNTINKRDTSGDLSVHYTPVPEERRKKQEEWNGLDKGQKEKQILDWFENNTNPSFNIYKEWQGKGKEYAENYVKAIDYLKDELTPNDWSIRDADKTTLIKKFLRSKPEFKAMDNKKLKMITEYANSDLNDFFDIEPVGGLPQLK